MASCSRCGSQTSLYDSGFPICPACSDQSEIGQGVARSLHNPEEFRRINLALTNARRAMREAHDKVEKYDAVYADLPPGHADGLQAVRTAREIFSEARARYKEALDAYVQYARKFSA